MMMRLMLEHRTYTEEQYESEHKRLRRNNVAADVSGARQIKKKIINEHEHVER